MSKQENREKFNEIKAQGKIALRQKMKEKAKKDKKRKDKTKRVYTNNLDYEEKSK
jgi:hypothetical protein